MSTTAVLQLVQQAAGEMGIPVPTTLVGNTNQDAIQLLALINACGYEIQRKHDWQALTKAYLFQSAYLATTGILAASSIITGIPTTAALSARFQVTGGGFPQNTQILTVDSAMQVTVNQSTTTTGSAQALTFSQNQYALPSDWDRQIDRTHWDKTQHWEMLGPETAQQWEWLTSGYISSGPRVRYRIFGNFFQIWPPQGTAHTLGFEYMSNAWAANAVGTAKSSFTVDTDTCIFNDRLMVLCLKHQYFLAKGLGDIHLQSYLGELNLAESNDSGSPTLSMAPTISQVLIGIANVPDSGYGT